MKAARRVNDYPTAVRIFEGMLNVNFQSRWKNGEFLRRSEDKGSHYYLGIKAKVENRGQYDQYLEELKPLREELGISLKEDLYPEEAK